MNSELNTNSFQFYPLDRSSIISGAIGGTIKQATHYHLPLQMILNGFFTRYSFYGKILPNTKRCYVYY